MRLPDFKESVNGARAADGISFYVGWTSIGILLGVLIAFSTYYGVALGVAVGVLIVIAKSPVKALACLILIAPFAGTEYLRESFFGIAGFKPIQIIAATIIILSVFNYGESERTPRWVFYSICAIVGIFTLSVLRSLQYVDLYNQHYYTKAKLSTYGYVLSEYVKPLIYFLPFFVIVKFVNTKEKLAFVMRIVYATLIILSVHLLYSYLFGMRDRGLEGASDYYQTYFGLHRNDLATFYVIGLPVAIGHLVLNRTIYNIIFNLIIISGIGVLFSRTGYLTAALGIFLYLVIVKRAKMATIIIGILIFIPLFVSGAVMERMATGMESKDKDVILSGRVESIWIPLIEEYIGSPKKLALGSGRYSILASDARKRGAILDGIAHPHNMYLEIIMDAGLVGLMVYILIYYGVVKNALASLRFLKDERIREYLYAGLVAIICFLVAGLTGRSLFPKYENIFLWVVLGSMISAFGIASDMESSGEKARP